MTRNLSADTLALLAQVDDGVVFLAMSFSWLLALVIVALVILGTWHWLIVPLAGAIRRRQMRRVAQDYFASRRPLRQFKPHAKPPGIDATIRRLM